MCIYILCSLDSNAFNTLFRSCNIMRDKTTAVIELKFLFFINEYNLAEVLRLINRKKKLIFKYIDIFFQIKYPYGYE